MSSDVKNIADAAAAATAVGTVMEVIPSIAGVFTIVWLGIRIWESDTVQGLVGKIRKKDASEE
jgi:hypothetical protein